MEKKNSGILIDKAMIIVKKKSNPWVELPPSHHAQPLPLYTQAENSGARKDYIRLAT